MAESVAAKVNAVLSKWNPLDVPVEVVEDEYKQYVDRIIHAGSHLEQIKSELILILTSDLGLHFDESSSRSNEEILQIAKEILAELSDPGAKDA